MIPRTVFTAEHEMFREQVRRFVEREIMPHHAAWEEAGVVPREAWHKAGVANGGTSIEDPPGVRPNGAYLAYLRDPDGNKIVAVAR